MSEHFSGDAGLAQAVPQVELPAMVARPGIFDRLRGKWAALAAIGALTIGITTSVEDQPAYASNTEHATIGMPFDGEWASTTLVNPDSEGKYSNTTSSHPSVHPYNSAHWATDVYAAPDTEAKFKVGDVSGEEATYTVSSVENTSCNAGKRVRVNVKIDNVNVGWVQYEHLDTNLTNGMVLQPDSVLGKTKNWGNLPCYAVSNDAGVHLHVAMKNTEDNYSCYTNHGKPGETTILAGAALGELGSSNDGAQQACAESANSGDNTVLKVIKKTADGHNLVFWAKAGTVFETSWAPGGNGPQHANLIEISQKNIKDVDVQINSDGQRLVYTAAGNHIYETWYYPGGVIHTNTLFEQVGNVKKIQKTIGPSGEQQLYVMTDQGVDEYWWWPNTNTRGHSRIYTIADPVAMEKMPLKPDSTQILYVADKSYVYENWWRPGQGPYTGGVVMHIPQADIKDLDVSVDNDGRHRAYVGRDRDGVWEAAWYRGSPVYTRQITGDNGVRDIEKYMNGNTHVVYVATQGGVFEYWWQPNETGVHGSVIAQASDVHSVDRDTTADGLPAVYTGANTKVYESWWGTGNAPVTAAIA